MKQRLLFLLLVCITVLALGTVTVSAETYGDLTYTITNGEVIITDCDQSATSVTIPAKIENYPVTSIGSSAFAYCYALGTIHFAGNAPTFGNFVFSNVTATAHYPKDDPTWTEEVRQDYADTITWVPYAATPTEHTHSFTNYVSNNDATCTADGTKTAKCDNCDATDTVTDVGSKKDHDFSDNAEYCKFGCGEKNPDYVAPVTPDEPEQSATQNRTTFSDVSSTDYFAEAVNWAVANGVTFGTSATTFSPNDFCTRAQIVTFLYRAQKK